MMHLCLACYRGEVDGGQELLGVWADAARKF